MEKTMTKKAFEKIKAGLEEVLDHALGVHQLSEESQDIFRRIAERDAVLEARHVTKRAS
jgi:hypothetical protein